MNRKIAYCIWCKDKTEAEVGEKFRDDYGYEVLLQKKERAVGEMAHFCFLCAAKVLGNREGKWSGRKTNRKRSVA